jgi:hypothetical protein
MRPDTTAAVAAAQQPAVMVLPCLGQACLPEMNVTRAAVGWIGQTGQRGVYCCLMVVA